MTEQSTQINIIKGMCKLLMLLEFDRDNINLFNGCYL